MGKTNSVERDPNMISLTFENEETQSGQPLIGKVSIVYDGRYDSISINSQIEDSSDVFSYVELQGKKINHPYARLSIMKKEILDPKKIEFKVSTQHKPIKDNSTAKFRATLIQEHKEIGSAVKFIRIKNDGLG
jgi:hypothetical protein